MVTMRLECGVGQTGPSAAQVAAALLSSARPGNGLEHVFAQPTPSGVEAVLFLVAASAELAALTAVVVCGRAADAMPGQYQLLSCAVAHRPDLASPHPLP